MRAPTPVPPAILRATCGNFESIRKALANQMSVLTDFDICFSGARGKKMTESNAVELGGGRDAGRACRSEKSGVRPRHRYVSVSIPIIADVPRGSNHR